MVPLTAACAVVFAAVHVFIGRLRFIDVIPRSRWLSFAGGVAVAYVFLHILPELAGHRATFAEGLQVSGRAGEAWIYLIALAGMMTFYGLERVAKASRRRSTRDRVESEVLWIHIVSFALYNLLIGYLLLNREEEGVWSLLIYVLAMTLHFVTNDYGLRQDQKDQYDTIGRWVIAGAVLVGWFIGWSVSLPPVAIGFVFAFLAGGVVLNVLKEELPEERQSRFLPFLLGAAGSAALLASADLASR